MVTDVTTTVVALFSLLFTTERRTVEVRLEWALEAFHLHGVKGQSMKLCTTSSYHGAETH